MHGGFVIVHVNGDGSFEWKNLPAGHYSVQISDASAMPDWFLKSVNVGGRDAADSGFTVGGGATTLDLLASGNGGTAEGVVSKPQDGPEKDAPVADAVVVAVSAPRICCGWETRKKVGGWRPKPPATMATTSSLTT